MYKQENNVISCKVCPSQTKSDTNATICNSCNQSLFCPLASVKDIDINHITSYPSSIDATRFEDILLKNMFSIENTAYCIAISSLFRILMVIMIVSLILLIIDMLKFFSKSHRHRALIKKKLFSTNRCYGGRRIMDWKLNIIFIICSSYICFFFYSVMNMLIFILLKNLMNQLWLVREIFEIYNSIQVLNF